MPPEVLDHWPSGARDTTACPDVELHLDPNFRQHLADFLSLEGVEWNDYEAQKVRLSDESRTDERLRTIRAMYERLGMVYEREGLICLSRLGQSLRSLVPEIETKRDSLIGSLRVQGAAILSRYQFVNYRVEGSNEGRVPDDCDVQPFLCIYKAFDRLGHKLHYEEMNRVLLRIMKMSDLDDAITKIAQARTTSNEEYDGRTDLDTLLGSRVFEDQESARIAPWFSWAGWGGLLIERNVDEDGFRNLVPEARQLVEDILADPPTFKEVESKDEWYNYYLADPVTTTSPRIQWDILESEDFLEHTCGLVGVENAFLQASAALRAGKHVILIGPPGTGKTELALCLCHKLHANYDLATATSDWTTFDTIGGYLPDPRESTGQLEFVDGHILSSIRSGRWLIIDEVNRADIDKAFGELFTVLGGGSGAVILPFRKNVDGELKRVAITRGGDVFEDTDLVEVDPDWRIIGTMNTQDKASLFQLSYAFMRRFAFVEVPSPEPAGFLRIISLQVASQTGLVLEEDGTFSGDPDLIYFWTDVRDRIRNLFCPVLESDGLPGIGLPIGPAVALDVIDHIKSLCNLGGDASSTFCEAIRSYVYPQFEGQETKHEEILALLCSVGDVDDRVAESRRLSSWTGFESDMEAESA